MTLPSMREHNDLNKQQFVGGGIFLFLCVCDMANDCGHVFSFFRCMLCKGTEFFITLSLEQKGTFAQSAIL